MCVDEFVYDEGFCGERVNVPESHRNYGGWGLRRAHGFDGFQIMWVLVLYPVLQVNVRPSFPNQDWYGLRGL